MISIELEDRNSSTFMEIKGLAHLLNHNLYHNAL